MKLIHCADLHLDARMESSLSKEKAKERRLELLRTFTRMVEQAAADGVDAVLICGDLFDAKTVSARAGNCVLDAVRQHPQMIFYYLQGNHDQNSFLKDLAVIPENLKTFREDWTSYALGDVVVTGAEASDGAWEGLADRLILDTDRVNIVMLHGMVTEYGGGGFSLRSYRGRKIDYLALGHIHSYRQEKLDDRGIWCYPGCLEGRGFDECGLKGYVLLEIMDKQVKAQFVPFAERTLHEVSVDVTGLLTQEEICRAVKAELDGIPAGDLVKIVLRGEVPPEAEKDADWLRGWLEHDYYHLRVKDETRLLICPEDYQYDISLKGEFVRQVLASGMTLEEKEQVLRLGIRALAGED